MNEITWGCPHCLRLNMWQEDDDYPYEVDLMLDCQHCKNRAIITKIRYSFETRKPQ